MSVNDGRRVTQYKTGRVRTVYAGPDMAGQTRITLQCDTVSGGEGNPRMVWFKGTVPLTNTITDDPRDFRISSRATLPKERSPFDQGLGDGISHMLSFLDRESSIGSYTCLGYYFPVYDVSKAIDSQVFVVEKGGEHRTQVNRDMKMQDLKSH